MTTLIIEDTVDDTTSTNLTPEYKYFKAVTPEALVNTKTRFDKNGIEWVEDISYRNTGNHAYFLKIPIQQVAKPAGCKRMYFIKYYPGPNDEFVSDSDAAMFYTMMYPRYEHIAKNIIENNNSIIPWDALLEPAKQHFTRTWGKIILTNIYTMTQWKLAPSNTRRPHELNPRPNVCSIEDECITKFIVAPGTKQAAERVRITISCDKKDVTSITSALSFESPTIYTLDNNNNVQ